MQGPRSPMAGPRSPFGARRSPAPFAVAFTGLSTDDLGSYGQIGNHASITYTIDPDNGTETVKWSASSDPAAAATFGTGANPTAFTSADGFSVFLHVTDGGDTVTRSFPARKAPATTGADLDLSFVEGTPTVNVNLVQNWTANGNTLGSASVSPALPAGFALSPEGVLSRSGTLSITADATYSLTMLDDYTRPVSDTFTLEVREAGEWVIEGNSILASPTIDPPTVDGNDITG